MTVTIENTNVDTTLNIAELTTASLTGTGVFDVLLQTLRLHLDREFTSGRITGTAYATVYSQALTAVLQQSVGFCLSKAKLALELQQMQEQVVLLQKQQDQITATIRQTDYITDYQLPADLATKNKQLALLDYDLASIKPQELALLQQQVAAQLYTVQTRLPVEVLGIEADTALKTYDLANVKPAELQSITADTSLKAYELTDIKPTQKAQIVAETSHVTKQELNTVQQTLNLGSQQAQIETETDRILYEITNKLPEEVQLIKLNQDQLTAQTNKIATDTVVAIKQGHLVDAQSCQVAAQTNQIKAEVALKLPEEVELVKRNQTMLTTQIAQVGAETTLKLPAEISQLEAQTALLNFDLATVKPAEVSNLTKQGLLVDSQKVVADKQALNVTAETNQINYRTNYQLPEEVKVIKYNQDMVVSQTYKVSVDTIVASKQGALLDAQVCEVKASANKTNAEVALKLPEEVEVLKKNQTQITAQIAEIDYRTESVLPSQVAQTDAQTAQVTYTTSNILPAQLALTTAQKESSDAQTALYEQKVVTETAQTTSTPAAGSVMGVQNALMAKQTENYERDAEQKAAKLLIDTLNVRFTADSTSADYDYVNHLSDADVGVAVSKLITGIGGTVAPPPPP